MSAQPKDGGPAFPCTRLEYIRGFAPGGLTTTREFAHGGMSMRDYFAAKAMQGWLATYTADCAFPETDGCAYIAGQFYRMADAMLAEREKAVQP